MKRPIIAIAVALAFTQAGGFVSAKTMAPKHNPGPAMYKCVKCGMEFTAAEAKADHYKCTMDGGKLVPEKKPASHA